MKKLFIGFIIGIGKIIPGVSGALLAILLGVYDKSIYYINNFKKNKKDGIKYLFPLGVGILVSIVFFSGIINYLLNEYYIFTMLFFVGLVIGTVPLVWRKVNKRNYIFTIGAFLIILLLSLFSIRGDYILKGNFMDIIILFISGLLEAIGTVIPGISSTSLLMLIGTYKLIIFSISDITNIFINMRVLIPFIIGIIMGLLLIIRLMEYMFKKYYDIIYAIIFGVLLSTIVVMIINSFKYDHSLFDVFLGLILMIVGIFISSFFDK